MFHHEIDTPNSQPAPGSVLVSGWCLTENHQAADVRLIADNAVLSPRKRSARPDVLKRFGAQPSALLCGFEIAGDLPPGAYLALVEASLDGVAWHTLRRMLLIPSADPLRGHLEYPTESRISTGAPLRGWCALPHRKIAKLELHYGNQQVPCDFGLPRPDVAAAVPAAPDAAHAGFHTNGPLPAGRGPLRLCATDTEGLRHFLQTGHTIDIPLAMPDGRAIDLAGSPARIAPSAPDRLPACAPRTPRPHRILFVLYGDMTSNSALHVAALADQLIATGHECIVAVPRDAETIRYHRHARFRCVDYAACGDGAPLFASGGSPDIVHAWTTAECVRRFAGEVCARTGARLVVHLEDHEPRILEAATELTTAALMALPAEALDQLVGDSHAHPVRGREFLAAAAGCTVILDRLAELVPPGRPVRTVWPAAAPEFFARPIPWPLRDALGWGAGHTVLFYHGNLHPANRDEVAALHEAVAILNETGTPTSLIRAGRDFCALPAALAGRTAAHVVALGRIDHQEHLAPLLALADCFVQPGLPDTFNRHRFPSKLPEFFASGRPVILPRANLGETVRDGIDALVLDRADAAGIAAAVRRLRADPALAAQLGTAAAAFAREHFSWPRSAAALAGFYDQILTTAPGPRPVPPS